MSAALVDAPYALVVRRREGVVETWPARSRDECEAIAAGRRAVLDRMVGRCDVPYAYDVVAAPTTDDESTFKA